MATAVFTPNFAGTYKVRVNAKDERGVVVKKDFSLEVYSTLKNTSTLASQKVKVGGTVTVNCSSTGGLGAKEYAVLYYSPKSSKWLTASGFTSAATVTFKPMYKGSYKVRVKARDTRNVVVVKDIDLEVTAS